MTLELLVIIACGVGTFLLRCFPIWRARNRAQSPRPSRPHRRHTRAQRFFAGIGPAALTALLLVSLWPFFRDFSHAPRLVSASIALIVIVVVKRLTRGLAAPTLLGAAVYGALMHGLTAA